MHSHADPDVRKPPPVGIGVGNRHRVAKQEIRADVDALHLSRGAVIGDPLNIAWISPRGVIVKKVPTAGHVRIPNKAGEFNAEIESRQLVSGWKPDPRVAPDRVVIPIVDLRDHRGRCPVSKRGVLTERQRHPRHKGKIELGRPGGHGRGIRREGIGIGDPLAVRIFRPGEIRRAEDTEETNHRRNSRFHSSSSHGKETMFFDESGSRNLLSASLSSMVSAARRANGVFVRLESTPGSAGAVLGIRVHRSSSRAIRRGYSARIVGADGAHSSNPAFSFENR
ncbi:MAG: hypothetical protein OJF51_001486 [Nitrospira sp.]|nr:MAG: hypothetical protein OJF51_001486 [Nitrospira sp.]